MTDKPNCMTCPIEVCVFHPLKKRPVRFDAPIFEIVRVFTKDRGCLSHPGAREYLMAPIIKELERKEADVVTLGASAAYVSAIDLIRNGVERK